MASVLLTLTPSSGSVCFMQASEGCFAHAGSLPRTRACATTCLSRQVPAPFRWLHLTLCAVGAQEPAFRPVLCFHAAPSASAATPAMSALKRARCSTSGYAYLVSDSFLVVFVERKSMLRNVWISCYQGDRCSDWLAYSCCHPCAMSQEAQEIRLRTGRQSARASYDADAPSPAM
jgi:hypothetical protein